MKLRINTDQVAARAQRLENEAARLRVLSSKVSALDTNVSWYTSRCVGPKSRAMQQLRIASDQIDAEAARLRRYLRNLRSTERLLRLTGMRPELIRFVLLRLGMPAPDGVGSTSTTLSLSLAAEALFFDAENKVEVTYEELPDGRLRVVIVDSSKQGVSAEFGAEGQVNGRGIEASAGVGAGVLEGDVRVYEIDPELLMELLAQEAARIMADGPGSTMGVASSVYSAAVDWGASKVAPFKPVAAGDRIGGYVEGDVELVKRFGVDAAYSYSSFEELRGLRKGDRTTMQKVTGANDAGFGIWNGEGKVAASMKVVEDAEGQLRQIVLTKTVVGSLAAVLEAESGGSDKGDKKKGKKKSKTSGSLGGSVSKTTTSEIVIDTTYNPELRARLEKLVGSKTALVNAREIAEIGTEFGVQTRYEHTIECGEYGAGAAVRAGVKLGGDVSGSHCESTLTGVAHGYEER